MWSKKPMPVEIGWGLFARSRHDMFVSVKVDMLLCLSLLLRWGGRASTSSGTSVDSPPHPSLHYHNDIGKTGDRVEGMRGYRRRWGRRGMRRWPVRGGLEGGYIDWLGGG